MFPEENWRSEPICFLTELVRANPGISFRGYADLVEARTGWRPSMRLLQRAVRNAEGAPRVRGRPRRSSRTDATASLHQAGVAVLKAFPMRPEPRRNVRRMRTDTRNPNSYPRSTVEVLIVPIGPLPPLLRPQKRRYQLDASVVVIPGLTPSLSLLWDRSRDQASEDKARHRTMLQEACPSKAMLSRRRYINWSVRILLSKRSRAALGGSIASLGFKQSKHGSVSYSHRTAQGDAIKQQHIVRAWVRLALRSLVYGIQINRRTLGRHRMQSHIKSLWRDLWGQDAFASDASRPHATL